MNSDIDFSDGCSSGGHRVALFRCGFLMEIQSLTPPSRLKRQYSHDNILVGIDLFRIVVTMSDLGESWRLASMRLLWLSKSSDKVFPWFLISQQESLTRLNTSEQEDLEYAGRLITSAVRRGRSEVLEGQTSCYYHVLRDCWG